MDQQRYLLEKEVLRKQRFPENAYRFVDIGKEKPYLRMAAKTNSGKVYTLHMDLREFPDQIPPVYVTTMLKDKKGEDLAHASSSMHTLSSENGWTRICHYGANAWTPMVSLFRIYVKCRLWLEAYEAHLSSGKPIDFYLIHSI